MFATSFGIIEIFIETSTDVETILQINLFGDLNRLLSSFTVTIDMSFTVVNAINNSNVDKHTPYALTLSNRKVGG